MWDYRYRKQPPYRGKKSGRYYKKKWNNPKKKQVPKGMTRKTAATYPLSNVTAQKTAITRQPVFGSASKLIRDQLYHETNLDLTLQPLVQDVKGIYFVANGVWDPYYPTGGHQVIGFDQMMQLYNHYVVIRSKITATFALLGADNFAAIQVGIAVFPEATPLASVLAQNLVENGYVKYITLSNQKPTGQVSLELDIKTYYGKARYNDILDDTALVGDVGKNPTEGVYYLVFAMNSLTEKENQVAASVVISYDTIYFEPRKLPLS